MKKSFLSALIFFGTVAILTVGYAAWNNPFTMSTVWSGSGLTANGWNALVNNLNDLNTRLTSAETTIASQATTISTMNTTISTLSPPGAVIAFNLTNCPTGWSEYTAAYGRFIRGIDKSGTLIDPDGQRTIGNIQTDAFQGHIHNIRNGGNGLGRPQGGGDDWMYTFTDVWVGASEFVISSPLSDGSNGNPRIANETRSKNVALLYCVKN